MVMTKDRGQGIVDTQGPIKIGREIAGCTWSVGLSIDDRGKLTVVEISKWPDSEDDDFTWISHKQNQSQGNRIVIKRKKG
jgi:hypothetical protein